MFPDLYLSGDDDQFTPGIPAHGMKLSAALRAYLVARAQVMLHHFHRQVFRQFVCCQTCVFTVVLFYLDEFGFLHIRVSKRFRLIEKRKLIRSMTALLAGRAELLVPGEPQALLVVFYEGLQL